jgi:hypothetical protein
LEIAQAAMPAAGMLVGRLQLDPAGAATVKAALDLYAAPKPQTLTQLETQTEDGQQVLIGEDRTRSQRYAHALTEIARRAPHHPPTSAEPPHVLIVATPEQVTAARTGLRGAPARIRRL